MYLALNLRGEGTLRRLAISIIKSTQADSNLKKFIDSTDSESKDSLDERNQAELDEWAEDNVGYGQPPVLPVDNQ